MLELTDFVRVLRRNWLVLLVVMLLGGGAAGYLSYTQLPQYQSTAKVFVSVGSSSDSSQLSQGNAFAQQVIKSYGDAATTPLVLNPIIDELDLNETAADLARKIDIEVVLDEVVLEIHVTDPSPSQAAEIANLVSERLSSVVNELTPGTRNQSPVKISLLQPALANPAPVQPRPMLNVALGVLVGLVIGLLIAFIRRALDNKVRTEGDVTAITVRPMLGGIQNHPGAKSQPLVVQKDPSGVRAEAYRTLRTNLQFLDFGREGRAIVITSPSSGEGKTTTSVNLALTIAAAEERTLLIDADLRAPRVAATLGIDSGIGLADVLAERAPLDFALQTWGETGLHVLPAGSRPPNPAELLQSKAFAQLLKELRRHYSTIIIDSPPLLPVSDALVITRRASGAIVVSAAGRTTRHRLRSALASLDRVEARVLGVVLTMVSTRGPDAYAYGRTAYTAVSAPAADAAAAERSERSSSDSTPSDVTSNDGTDLARH